MILQEWACDNYWLFRHQLLAIIFFFVFRSSCPPRDLLLPLPILTIITVTTTEIEQLSLLRRLVVLLALLFGIVQVASASLADEKLSLVHNTASDTATADARFW